MSAYSFPNTEYDSVRGAIGLDVDDVSLPDTIIALSVHQGEAENFIMTNLTEAQWSDPTQAANVLYAATAYLASLIAPKIRLVQSEKITGGNITYEKTDLAQLAARLAERAEQRIAQILKELGATSPNNPIQLNVFTLGHRRIDF